MKILLVDDELMIKEWLTLTIRSLPFDIELIETASSGQEALERLTTRHFDLILIDIKMPKMNGLELVRAIREQELTGFIVILSSHDEFSFAKEAIKYNVQDYILKSECSKEKLHEILQRCQDSLAPEAVSEGLKRELFERVLRGDIPQAAIMWVTSTFPGAFEHPCCVLVTPGTDAPLSRSTYPLSTGRGVQLGLLGIDEKRSFQLISLISDGKESPTHLSRELSQLISTEQGCQVAAGKVCQSPSEVLRECRNALTGFHSLFYSDRSFTYGPHQVRQLDGREVEQLCDTALSQIRSFSKERTIETLQQLDAYIRKTEPTDVDTVIHIYHSLLSSFVIFTNKHSRSVTEKLTSLNTLIHSFDSFEALSQWVLKTIESDADLIRKNSYSSPVKGAILFIEENYQSIRSINEIAEHVNLSLDYFSRLFKREVGETLHTYLIHYRLDKASLMLISTDLPIQSIALSVGIENGGYFSKCFKKKFHTTPIRFRIRTSEQGKKSGQKNEPG